MFHSYFSPFEETAEFKNLLMGTMSSTQNMADDDDSDSEDSMAKIERQYQQLALSKTNTIPVGYVIGYFSTCPE